MDLEEPRILGCENNLKINVILFVYLIYYSDICIRYLNHLKQTNMDIVCDFSVSGLDNEVEDICMYDDEICTEKKMTEFVERIVKEKKIRIGERCEGDISFDGDKVIVEYKYCSQVGDDWDTDEWEEDQRFETTRVEYGL